uniref:Uncharacterized protein n=1 Tax=Tanacetum cinerariifolium TaxID=118510 RepID=A0A6L2NJ13_TANCI|nr:hypothetical protein [Tanacetum cinerariifolium]
MVACPRLSSMPSISSLPPIMVCGVGGRLVLLGKQPAHLISSGFNQCEKQTSNTVRTTQSVCLYEGSDNVPSSYGSTCDIISVEAGMGVFVIPFGQSHVYGDGSASEGSFHLSGSPSVSCHTEKAQLYIDMFQKYSELCRRNSTRECIITFKAVVEVGRLDIGKQKLQTSDVADVFQAYFDLCSMNVRRRCSANLPQCSRALNFSSEEITDSNVFQRYTDLCATRATATLSPTLLITVVLSFQTPQKNGWKSAFVPNNRYHVTSLKQLAKKTYQSSCKGILKERAVALETIVVGYGSDNFMSQGNNKDEVVNAPTIESSGIGFSSPIDDNNIMRR